MDDDAPSPAPYISLEVSDFVSGMRQRGHIAVDTPELRAHVQQRLLSALMDEVREAGREEFLTTDEVGDLEELAEARDDAALDEQLRVQLPLYSELVPQLLTRIEDELVNR